MSRIIFLNIFIIIFSGDEDFQIDRDNKLPYILLNVSKIILKVKITKCDYYLYRKTSVFSKDHFGDNNAIATISIMIITGVTVIKFNVIYMEQNPLQNHIQIL